MRCFSFSLLRFLLHYGFVLTKSPRVTLIVPSSSILYIIISIKRNPFWLAHSPSFPLKSILSSERTKSKTRSVGFTSTSLRAVSSTASQNVHVSELHLSQWDFSRLLLEGGEQSRTFSHVTATTNDACSEIEAPHAECRVKKLIRSSMSMLLLPCACHRKTAASPVGRKGTKIVETKSAFVRFRPLASEI